MKTINLLGILLLFVEALFSQLKVLNQKQKQNID